MMRDGHIHSPYCPHGTKDPLIDYVERAIELGYKEITFTEHAPLPKGFIDPTPNRDSAMSYVELESYFTEIENVKMSYKNHLKINIGLEIDFIEGFEEETKLFLNEIGPRLDDSILSVHFLKNGDQYECVDYSPDVFSDMIKKYGSIDHVYRKYFETLKQSVLSNLGVYKPKRIGHITLVKKFHLKYPTPNNFESEVLEILELIKTRGYELDYNGAGVAKPLCKEPYPHHSLTRIAYAMGIPLIYGSDAHQVKDLNQGRNKMELR